MVYFFPFFFDDRLIKLFAGRVAAGSYDRFGQ
jgi:hypothetical protein